LNVKLLYRQLFFLLTGVVFSLTLFAQSEIENDTIVITPKGNYSVLTDSVKAGIKEKNSEELNNMKIDETNLVLLNDSLISVYRPIPEDTIRAISLDKRFYYKKYFDSLLRATQVINKPVKINPPIQSIFKSIFNITIWIGAISLLAFLVFKLFLSNSSLFAGSRKNNSVQKIAVDEESPENPGALVEQAVRNGNYRFAVRYLYLQTLMNLAMKNYVQAGSEKTNFQYVQELLNQPFVNEFSSLTLQYEYAWYGEYNLDGELFEQIHIRFKNFNKKII